MAAKPKYRSRILEAVHEGARGMRRAGVIDDARMAEYDVLCLPLPEYTPRKIKAIRKRHELTQVLLASVMKISPSTVRQWEQGVKKPSGMAQLLLYLIDTKGLSVLK